MSDANKLRTNDVIINDADVVFESLLLSPVVLNGLRDYKYIRPSPIQLKAIPLGKCGFDLVIKAKSGTGKTGVFSIIALEMVDTTIGDLQVLVLAPTREIAVQSCSVISSIGKYIQGLKVEHFIGGLPLSEDKTKSNGCHIAVGSPGRILHLIKDGILSTNHTKLFVLDEADSLMDQSYQSDINQIYHHLPQNKQMLAVSATYPANLDTFLANYMHAPTHISPQMDTPFLLGLKHFVSITTFNANVIISTKIKNSQLIRLLTQVSFTQCLIFCNYQTRAEQVSNFLNTKDWKSNFISAAQTQKQRMHALEELKSFQCRILLSTDLCARGIDAVHVDLVINYDVPHDECTYLHRMGRAGRYGSKGLCITLAAEGAEIQKFQEIIGSIGGTEMSVPVLPPKELLANVWEADTSSFDRIHGMLKERSSINTQDILQSVKEIRTNNTPQVKHNTSRKVKTAQSPSPPPPPPVALQDDNETLRLLKQLASGDQVSSIDHDVSSMGTVAKNISLLSVCSLLDNDNIDDSADDVTSQAIDNFITNIKQQDHQHVVAVCDEDPIINPDDTSSDIEYVFEHAYDFAVGRTKANWSDVYQVAEEDECTSGHEQQVNLLQDLLEYAANDEDPEYDYDDEEWIPVESKVPDSSVEVDAPSAAKQLTQLTSESTNPNTDKQTHYTEMYGNAIHNFSTAFSTLECESMFEASWRNWQTQMNSIREYVQQNIYLDEMNLNLYKIHKK